MTNSILVSFVVPTFNSEKFIEECILSIINQKNDNVEIVVIDGMSTDGTLKILEKYRKFISILISEEDGGIYDAINKGIGFCKGSLIKILNSDDKLTDDSLKRALEAYKTNLPKSGSVNFIIMSTLVRIDKSGQRIALWGKSNNTLFFENLLHPSWYVPMDIYKNYGFYDLSYSIASDYEYFMRLKKNNVKLFKSNIPLTQFREGGASNGGKGRLEVYKIKRIYKGFIKAKLLLLQIDIMIFLSKIKRFLKRF